MVFRSLFMIAWVNLSGCSIQQRTGKTAGNLIWDGTGGNGQQMPEGIYFYQAKANGMTATGKIILVD